MGTMRTAPQDGSTCSRGAFLPRAVPAEKPGTVLGGAEWELGCRTKPRGQEPSHWAGAPFHTRLSPAAPQGSASQLGLQGTRWSPRTPSSPDSEVLLRGECHADRVEVRFCPGPSQTSLLGGLPALTAAFCTQDSLWNRQ